MMLLLAAAASVVMSGCGPVEADRAGCARPKKQAKSVSPNLIDGRIGTLAVYIDILLSVKKLTPVSL